MARSGITFPLMISEYIDDSFNNLTYGHLQVHPQLRKENVCYNELSQDSS